MWVVFSRNIQYALSTLINHLFVPIDPFHEGKVGQKKTGFSIATFFPGWREMLSTCLLRGQSLRLNNLTEKYFR